MKLFLSTAFSSNAQNFATENRNFNLQNLRQDVFVTRPLQPSFAGKQAKFRKPAGLLALIACLVSHDGIAQQQKLKATLYGAYKPIERVCQVLRTTLNTETEIETGRVVNRYNHTVECSPKIHGSNPKSETVSITDCTPKSPDSSISGQDRIDCTTQDLPTGCLEECEPFKLLIDPTTNRPVVDMSTGLPRYNATRCTTTCDGKILVDPPHKLPEIPVPSAKLPKVFPYAPAPCYPYDPLLDPFLFDLLFLPPLPPVPRHVIPPPPLLRRPYGVRPYNHYHSGNCQSCHTKTDIDGTRWWWNNISPGDPDFRWRKHLFE